MQPPQGGEDLLCPCEANGQDGRASTQGDQGHSSMAMLESPAAASGPLRQHPQHLLPLQDCHGPTQGATIHFPSLHWKAPAKPGQPAQNWRLKDLNLAHEGDLTGQRCSEDEGIEEM